MPGSPFRSSALVLTTYDYGFVVTQRHSGQGASVCVAPESYPPAQLQQQSDGNKEVSQPGRPGLQFYLLPEANGRGWTTHCPPCTSVGPPGKGGGITTRRCEGSTSRLLAQHESLPWPRGSTQRETGRVCSWKPAGGPTAGSTGRRARLTPGQAAPTLGKAILPTQAPTPLHPHNSCQALCTGHFLCHENWPGCISISEDPAVHQQRDLG